MIIGHFSFLHEIFSFFFLLTCAQSLIDTNSSTQAGLKLEPVPFNNPVQTVQNGQPWTIPPYESLKQICWIILLKLIELGNASKFKNFSAPGLVNASSYEAKDHMKSNSKSVSEEDPGDSDVSEERFILIENEIIKLIFLITSKTR